MKVITIGRGVGNDVDIPDLKASRHHLQIIQHDNGNFTLSDFGSLNGTFVNGQKIQGEVPLNEMDIVRIGNTTIPWRMYFEESGAPTEIVEQPISKSPLSSTQSIDKERHGFVTFWLWLSIVISVITAVRTLISFFQIASAFESLTSLYDSIKLHTNIMMLASFVFAVCCIGGYAMVMNWKKLGFWFLVGTSIVSVACNMIMNSLLEQDYAAIDIPVDLFFNSIVQLIVTPISIVILWAILQIRKNGVSCWKQLE